MSSMNILYNINLFVDNILTDNVARAYVDHDETAARSDCHGWYSLPLKILEMTKPDSCLMMETLHFEPFLSSAPIFK